MKLIRLLFTKIFLLSLLLHISAIGFAQQKKVTGTITDAGSNEPLVGAYIKIDGTTQGTITDMDGKFALDVPSKEAVLTISFIGYTPQKITVGDQTVLQIKLAADATKLDEVVVVGYGTQKKSDVTGSVSSIKKGEFNIVASGTPSQMIQGKVAGVQIVANNGEPGAGSSIKIRGASSIRSGTQPLYVIDGIPLDMSSNSPSSGSGYSAPATDPLSFINPNDIETMDVLKDASAAAIYGSRAANGVVLITTKKGKDGQSEVSYSTSVSISSLRKKLDVLSASDWLKYRQNVLGTTENNMGAATDWQDQVFRTGIGMDHNLSLSGGTSKTTYRAALNYTNQKGIMENSDMKKYSGRLSLTQKALNDKILFETALTASEVFQNRLPIGANGFEGDVLLNSLQANPTWPVNDASGAPFQTGSANERNPSAMLAYTKDLTRETRIMGSISASAYITKELTYKISLGLDYANANRVIDQSQKLDYEKSTMGLGQRNNLEKYNYIVEHTLNFNKTIGKSNIAALAGYSYQEFQVRSADMSAGGFATDGIQYTNKMGSGTQSYTSVTSGADAYKLQSFFGRVNYSLMDKYLITATVRSDGSSKFGENKQYGTFPSFAVGWRLGEESFIKNTDIFSNLKLRLGWGQTGNSEIGTKNSQTLYSPDNATRAIIGGNNVTGLMIIRTPNPDITWETTTSSNFGIDYSILKGRLSGGFDLYKKVTSNLLLPIPAQSVSPTSIVYQNVSGCKIANSGIEISLSGLPFVDKDFSWEISSNITFMKNEVTDLPTQMYQTGAAQGQGLSGAYCQIITSGQPMNVFYGQKITSIGSDGKVNYLKTASGKDSLTYLGNPQPDFTWSITNTFKYKKFDLSIFIDGVNGNKIFNNTALLLEKTNLKQAKNSLSYFANDNVDVKNYTPLVSDRYIEDGSYTRLSNITLGYTYEFNKLWAKRMRIYASGSNLMVFTKYHGFDPDVTSSKELNGNGINSFGIDVTNYPKARTYILGLNITF